IQTSINHVQKSFSFVYCDIMSTSQLSGNVVWIDENRFSLSCYMSFADNKDQSGGHPFSNKRWDTCAVIGNGGIVANSSCGKMINSADFVIRCNLPPLSDGYEKDVGTKTNLVTANPTILFKKFESLDFESAIHPVFINPEYLIKLSKFWHAHGLKEARLSTGVMMTSLALELCDDVHLYGFWPFGIHPFNFKNLTNHYYDDMKPNTNFHSMPVEFSILLQLHRNGVLRLHLGDCQ
uniref:ST8 alpha-N-acetyl-neuraminide alpha-2,8-sialyltransferase 6 n=1 Tax=Xiphophorus couchianus TaxID=32473 RepID=A0A3B5MPX0_9TELE